MKIKREYINTELDFKKAFIRDSSSVLKNARFWKHEYPLYDAIDLLNRQAFLDGLNDGKSTGKPIGRIDLVFSYRSKLYVAEVKYHNPTDFWDATKVIAYTAYYNYQNEIRDGFDRAHPAIFVPIKKIKLAHKIVANRLNCVIFGIEYKDGIFTATAVNL